MKHINEYNEFEKNLFSQVNSKPEVFIANLIKDLEVKYFKEYPKSTFFVHKDSGKIWMEYSKGTEHLWVSYEHIWSRVEQKFPYNNQQIKDLIKYTVETAFKMKVGKPEPTIHSRANWWKSFLK